MLLGELIKKTGFPKDTIRFYEKKGLIKLGRKQRRENNYKEYSEEDVDRLLFIRTLKNLGFTLNEIEEFLLLKEMNEATCEGLKPKFYEKIQKINDQMQLLEDLKNNLTRTLAKCENNDCVIENSLPSCVGGSCH
jgi:DNA-binding transcriptional MerR regulator